MLDNVTSIGQDAFSLSGLTSVSIGKGVTSINNNAFQICNALKEINVDTGNTTYSSQDGVLYNNDKSTLIQYPIGKTGAFTIPDGVKSMGNGLAFLNCKNLTSVTIPASVTSIKYQAFGDCQNLTSVTFLTGSDIAAMDFGSNAFPAGRRMDLSTINGDTLKDVYLAASPKAGTYIREQPNGNVWWKP